jgi:hypothetical protein
MSRYVYVKTDISGRREYQIYYVSATWEIRISQSPQKSTTVVLVSRYIHVNTNISGRREYKSFSYEQ